MNQNDFTNSWMNFFFKYFWRFTLLYRISFLSLDGNKNVLRQKIKNLQWKIVLIYMTEMETIFIDSPYNIFYVLTYYD